MTTARVEVFNGHAHEWTEVRFYRVQRFPTKICRFCGIGKADLKAATRVHAGQQARVMS